MNGKAYPDETKAVVMASLLTGQSVNSVAKEYNIPKRTVSNWKRLAGEIASESTQKKLPPIGDKLIDLLMTEVDSLIETSKIARSPDWIMKQSAADLAVYLGVKHDKLFRMIEAFNKNDDRDSIPED
jgi:transposase-like protein